MALGNILLYLMVYENSFLLVVRVEQDLTVRVGGVKGFIERGRTWVDNMFSREIVE